MKKKALLIGINYPGTQHALRGCINDVNTMNDMVSLQYGFNDPKNRKIITDRDATTQNILENLEWLVDEAQPGDVLLFHYSGHGSQFPDLNGDENDGLDEILCPIDLDWRTKMVKDDDLCRIFNKVPQGVNATVVLDCCHSGDGIDSIHAYQPEVATKTNREIIPIINRYMPIPNDILMEHLSNRSWKFNSEVKKPIAKNDTALLISGCRSHQTSADALINGTWCGAATFFLKRTLINNQHDITYKFLTERMNIHLANRGYTQRPELNGKKDLFNKKFLQPFV